MPEVMEVEMEAGAVVRSDGGGGLGVAGGSTGGGHAGGGTLGVQVAVMAVVLPVVGAEWRVVEAQWEALAEETAGLEARAGMVAEWEMVVG